MKSAAPAVTGTLALVAYRAIVAGERTGRIDLQVRWFATNDPCEAKRLILDEPFHHYENDARENVLWELVEVLEVERFSLQESGDEVIGIITTPSELAALT